MSPSARLSGQPNTLVNVWVAVEALSPALSTWRDQCSSAGSRTNGHRVFRATRCIGWWCVLLVVLGSRVCSHYRSSTSTRQATCSDSHLCQYSFVNRSLIAPHAPDRTHQFDGHTHTADRVAHKLARISQGQFSIRNAGSNSLPCRRAVCHTLSSRCTPQCILQLLWLHKPRVRGSLRQ